MGGGLARADSFPETPMEAKMPIGYFAFLSPMRCQPTGVAFARKSLFPEQGARVWSSPLKRGRLHTNDAPPLTTPVGVVVGAKVDGLGKPC